MYNIKELGTGFWDKTNTITDSLISYLPQIITVFLAIIIGYFASIILKKVVVKIAKKLKLNELIAKTDTDEQLKKAGIKMDIPNFLGNLVKWIIILATFMFITDVLDLKTVQTFLSTVLETIGRIIVALLVFTIAVYASRFAETIAESVAKYIKISNSKLIGNITAGIIYFMALLVILDVLKIEVIKNLVLDIIRAVVYGITIAVGLAFGLGGQEKAKELLGKIQK